ncbi:poly(3-hydroxybutyrate) depolymerase [Kribbella italica]|uniref:Poly(3-hydroxybutyrate) depolymerase n=1 Tax=Kribbella italica TaxID=1540520 RepID=A0A7W9JBA6_9ACTN|nr:poly(3-hydroxybutyrate) depolymerase [Kribbella italica]
MRRARKAFPSAFSGISLVAGVVAVTAQPAIAARVDSPVQRIEGGTCPAKTPQI